MNLETINSEHVHCVRIRNNADLDDHDVLNYAADLTAGWMSCIQTKYKSGWIICSKCGERGFKRFPYSHSLSTSQNHLAAAIKYQRQIETNLSSFKLVGVNNRSESGYVYTFV